MKGIIKIKVPPQLSFIFDLPCDDERQILFRIKDDVVSGKILNLIELGVIKATEEITSEEYYLWEQNEQNNRGVLI